MNTFRKRFLGYLALAVFVAVTVVAGSAPLAGQRPAGDDRLVVFGDTVFFIGPGIPLSCTLSNRYKRGDNVGFRMTAINPATGKRDRATQLVVHITYGGKTLDLPMQDRQDDRVPEREFWIAKWTVPPDAPIGIVRYSVTAKDPQGRTGEYKPFEVAPSQVTIIE